MIRIKTVTAKNFLSIGNASQAVNFEKELLTLVLGENTDTGTDASHRNGVGKCVAPETTVRLRNKTTGEIFETTVKELYDSTKSNARR